MSGSGWGQDRQPDSRNANDAAQPADRDKPTPTSGKPNENGWNPEEKSHRKWERAYWVTIVFLTAIAGGGAAVSAIYTYGTAFQARRQADAAVDALAQSKLGAQPYLIPDFDRNERIAPRPWRLFEQGSGQTAPLSQTYDLHFQLTNYGSTPAILHRVRTVILFDEQKLTQNAIDVSYGTGFVITPGTPGGPAYAAVYQVRPEMDAIFQTGKYPFHVVGLIEFSGVGGEPLTFKFCYNGAYRPTDKTVTLSDAGKEWFCTAPLP